MHKLMRYIKGYEKQAVLAPLFKMLEATFELFVPLVVASIIDTGIKNGDAVFIWQRCGLLILLAAIGLTCSLTAQYFSAKAALGFGTPMHAGLVLTCGFRGHISFDADDGLDAIGHAVGVHLVGAMHVAMVGDADRRHAKFGGAFGQIRNLRRTIEQRIVRVVMQLHKVVPVISHALHHTVWSGQR